jgi:hypothetical protein
LGNRGKNFKSNDNSRNAASGQKPSGPRVRTCYNYGEKHLFLVEYSYEKRAENGG